MSQVTGEKPVQKLPEPSGWLANAILGCLREWRTRDGRGMLTLFDMDLDQLENWAADLQKAWVSTADTLKRDGFDVVEYPTRIRVGRAEEDPAQEP